jgi:hypothetical protein
MERYETRIENGTFSIEGQSGWLRIGEMETICDLVGGETYTIEYDDKAQTVGWLDTAADGTITFDVRETLAEMSYDEEFVGNLANIDRDATDEEGNLLRASVFANMMTEIWDSKGNL